MRIQRYYVEEVYNEWNDKGIQDNQMVFNRRLVLKKTNISINRTNNNHNGEVTERTTASLEHDDNCIDTKGKGGRIRLLVHFQQSNGYWIS